MAQFNIVEKFEELIDQEIAFAVQGKKAKITVKLNNLENKQMIRKLYEASSAGVKIELIVRGICCLVPGVRGQSENISITRIVDRFLEHTRVFVFWNDGNPLFFSGSADWMTRNLLNRVEVIFPILDKTIQSQIQTILRIQLSDNVKACVLSKNLLNESKENEGKRNIRSQYEINSFVKDIPTQLI